MTDFWDMRLWCLTIFAVSRFDPERFMLLQCDTVSVRDNLKTAVRVFRPQDFGTMKGHIHSTNSLS